MHHRPLPHAARVPLLGALLLGACTQNQLGAPSAEHRWGVSEDAGPATPPGEDPPASPPPPPAPSGPAGPSPTCADVELRTALVTPTVILVVDQSGSMNQDLGGVSRWEAVHEALTGPVGVVTELEGLVRFGVALYTYDGTSATCPQVTERPAVVSARDGIDALLRVSTPAANTPTGESIDAVLDAIAATPDPDPGPILLVLATDGNPDRCADPDGHDDVSKALSVAAVERGHAMGVETFVIGVGDGTVSADHLAALASAGAGAPDAPYWEAGDVAGLGEALRAIVVGALSCEVELDGAVVPGTECSGTVRLSGMPLPCDDPNGWRLVDETHIELLGAACETLLAGPAELLATFPCEALVI